MIAGGLSKQFIAVAEELHFARAAERLHMSQPPLSQAIKHLEEMVGVRLFNRSRHFVALTPAGEAFLEEARNLLATGQKAIDTARRINEGKAGRVRIGFVGSVSYALLPRLLRDLRNRHPAIEVDLRELRSQQQIDELAAGRIDIGIVRLPLSNAGDLSFRTIETERFIAVLPRHHRLARARSVRLRELAGETFMTFPADKIPGLHAKFLMACDEAGFSPKITLEAWQMAGMVSLVAAGMGIALLPAQVRSTSHTDVVYKTIADKTEHLELRIALAWRPDNHSAGVTSVLSLFGPAET
ncbi:LysR family transcriptional regulator [Rhizobium sp. NTR19]|uniref:LysR family transcriptional regulator n=1 Tax=Neorhizobium turbinariae TaxID=2937795 RepID=A0ABT0IQ88_9HYPH|nr:LysR family transcriptional regulator [Neorhizobium turbinariae]MCK8780031.1 LysR family transcriptional regulator [Neorhizobium turbinariae]